MEPIPAFRKRSQEQRDSEIKPEPSTIQDAGNTFEIIQTLIPPDRPFTVADMIGWLRSTHPERIFNEATIRVYVSRLCSRGVVMKLPKYGSNCSRWVASEAYKT